MRRAFANTFLAIVLVTLAAASPVDKTTTGNPGDIYRVRLPQGRKLEFVRVIGSSRDLDRKRSFWKKAIDFVAGAAEEHPMVRPYDIAIDSRGRLIVTDPGAQGIHVFDVTQNRYKFIERREAGRDPMETPQCVAIDAQDNFYVTDSTAGKVFVFNRDGKFARVIGSLSKGEGYFKRPSGITIDRTAQRIYVTDTARDKVFVLSLDGAVQTTFGGRGDAPGQFNFPTVLLFHNDQIAVVDAMNSRVQMLDRNGAAQSIVAGTDEAGELLFRPKGIGFDSEDHLYVADALGNAVQVFNEKGQMLYWFGGVGTGVGEFQLPTGLLVDDRNKVYVVDSFNRRVQIFQYVAVKQQGMVKR